METLTVRILTPDRTLFEGEVAQATLPTAGGEITVLPHHVPLVTPLGSGELRLVDAAGSLHVWVATGGVIEVAGSGITILAEVGEHVEELADEAAIAEAHERAQQAMEQADRMDHEEYALVAARLEHELARLRAVRKYKNRQVS